jgi:choline dehydrogenase
MIFGSRGASQRRIVSTRFVAKDETRRGGVDRAMPSARYDVAIVGGGAAGCVLARRLAEAAERSVVLIEAGPDVGAGSPADWHDGWRLPVPPDWGFESEPSDGGETRKLRRGRLVGGTSWLTRFAVRGGAADFDAWAARGNPGWSFQEVLSTFRRVETDAEYGRQSHHGDRGPIPITRYPAFERSAIHVAAIEAFQAVGFPAVDDHNAPDAVGAGPMPMSSRDGIRVTSADAASTVTAPPTTGSPAGVARRSSGPVGRGGEEAQALAAAGSSHARSS